LNSLIDDITAVDVLFASEIEGRLAGWRPVLDPDVQDVVTRADDLGSESLAPRAKSSDVISDARLTAIRSLDDLRRSSMSRCARSCGRSLDDPFELLQTSDHHRR
jgi:hypothetical protein